MLQSASSRIKWIPNTLRDIRSSCLISALPSLPRTTNMRFVTVVLACMVAGLSAAPITLLRTPSHDSAIIRSDRLGGNFAYSVEEGHAYAAVSPIVQHVASPVAVSYHAPAVSYHAPAVVAPAIHHAPAVVAPVHAPVVAPYAHHGVQYTAPYAAHAVAYDTPTYEFPQDHFPAFAHLL